MHFSILEKLGLGLLCAMWLVWGSAQIGNMLVRAEEGNIAALKIVADVVEEQVTEVEAVEELSLIHI